MKTAIRLFALGLVAVSVAAASSAPGTAKVSSHQAASASVPLPGCGPYVPGCNMTKQ